MILSQLGNIDIYLLDQLLKGRITTDMRILDAGCGSGRNAQYFVKNNFEIWGIDKQAEAIDYVQDQIQAWNPHYDPSRFQVADLKTIPFPDAHFDFIISSAVLHFSENRAQFMELLKEHFRVLRPQGIFWCRMTTKHTLEAHAQHLYDDIYALADGSTRYLLDLALLEEIRNQYQLEFLDLFKTVNVSNLRTMAVVVLIKD